MRQSALFVSESSDSNGYLSRRNKPIAHPTLKNLARMRCAYVPDTTPAMALKLDHIP